MLDTGILDKSKSADIGCSIRAKEMMPDKNKSGMLDKRWEVYAGAKRGKIDDCARLVRRGLLSL